MNESPEKPLNFSKLKDQKKFDELLGLDKEIKILDAQDEAEVLRQWMILDHVQPTTEEASFYIKKLEKYRKLYRHISLAQIARRLDIELPVLSAEYFDYIGENDHEDITEELTTEEIIKRIEDKNPGIGKEDLDRIIKNIVVVCIQDENRIFHSEVGKTLAIEYLKDDELIEKIAQIDDEEYWKSDSYFGEIQDTQKEIYKNLEPVLIFEIYLIVEFKTLIENDPNIDRDTLQEKLMGRLRKWKNKPAVYKEIEEAFTHHLDLFMQRRMHIQNFKEKYETNREEVMSGFLKFKPSQSPKVIFGPYSINIVLQPADYEIYSKNRKAMTDSHVGLHLHKTPFNIIKGQLKEKDNIPIIHHEDLHALEDLIKREGSAPRESYKRLLYSMNSN
ncbi:MAG: hypothetical protein WCT44_04110, partial [Candidatus Paceibacterota bacterium]